MNILTVLQRLGAGRTLEELDEAPTAMSAAGALALPATILVGIPVLKGHLGADDKPAYYPLEVRIRVSADDTGRLVFRLTCPTAERILEEVYADRVRLARDLLGEAYQLWRGAD